MPDHNEYIIVDTGSPNSYHRLGNIYVNGKQYSCETEIPAINYSTLSKQIGLPICGLLGMDILSQLCVLFDYQNECIDFDHIDLIGQPLLSDSIMGIPTIQIAIANEQMQVFLDSGAPISYINSRFTHNMVENKRIDDFYPEIGSFTTPIYTLPVSVGKLEFEAEFGNLPFLMESSLSLANTNGIIGYELFSHFKVLIAGGTVYIQPNNIPINVHLTVT